MVLSIMGKKIKQIRVWALEVLVILLIDMNNKTKHGATAEQSYEGCVGHRKTS